MSTKLVFLYDGQCPFCNKFAELLELKSSIPNLSIIDGRTHPREINDLLKNGYDLDNGAILLKNKEILHGSSAINWICSQIENPSNSLLKILAITFSSSKRTDFIFPFLLIARRTLLFFKGVPNKIRF
ncbi:MULTISPECIES: DCC1-like thiol-disulfide oxidoreductase family protein [unclassified Prochlorococcus]|uniref:DCC1-like thiol-disulfide oxidoreductase family protein n=1 Tax=unclassified Prochlorococcus TaxID=2627481 RepID=UPI000533BE4E|nr:MULTISPECIES: DCC1-like thiol-disulfide oxidoreductase family protein [unclassified Prochlorococcus]KGG16159.1 hypothetical protein EV06_0869 [Prochlorococcus sp. MIT 0602]KGG17279.1 hypothetical protein EV07_0717 [Prochlorococcus sp. MIT 0603]